MKERLKRQIKWWCVCIIVTLASLNLGAQAIAEPVLLSEKIGSSSPVTSASELFRDVYQKRYTWDSQFPGYTAAIDLKDGKKNYKGSVRVNPDMSVQVTGIEKEDARQVVENQVRMLIIHRQRIPFEVAHKNSTFEFGNTDKTGAVEIFERQVNQPESHYKVLDQQLVQVNRLLGKTAVTVDTLNSQVTPEGYLATRYRSTFFSPQTKEVVGVEESEDTYKKVGGYYLPSRQIIQDFEQGQLTQTAEFNYTNIQLLSGG